MNALILATCYFPAQGQATALAGQPAPPGALLICWLLVFYAGYRLGRGPAPLS